MLRLRCRLGSLGAVLLQERLRGQDDEKCEREDEQKSPLSAGFLLGILKVWQMVTVRNVVLLSISECERASSAPGTTDGVDVRLFPDNRVKAPPGEGMAAQQPNQRHPSTAECTIALHRFHGVFGAGGDIAAGGREPRRDRPFISAQHHEHEMSGDLHNLTPRLLLQSTFIAVRRFTAAFAAFPPLSA